MKSQLLSPKAKQDLEHIWDYTEETWGVPQAELYITVIRQTLNGLCEGTIISQSAQHIRNGYRKTPAGSHIVFFKETHDSIEVIRILHQRMDTARLFSE